MNRAQRRAAPKPPPQRYVTVTNRRGVVDEDCPSCSSMVDLVVPPHGHLLLEVRHEAGCPRHRAAPADASDPASRKELTL